jgi:GDP-D-mannose dehydratase
MSPVITITGSTGKVGKTIAEILLTKGAKVKPLQEIKIILIN